MKTAKWLILAICVAGSHVANGQYDDGVPPVFLPEAKATSTKSVSKLKSASLVRTKAIDPIQSGAITESVQNGCGCTANGGCDGSCNDFGLLCGSGSSCSPRRKLGTSFFRRCNSGCNTGGCNTGSSRIKFSINRGPQTCNQCGCDNRTFLQRILPISVSMRSNHESRYTSFFGGYHDMEDIRAVDRLIDFDDSFILGFARGRRFCGRIRLESEFTIRNAPAGDYFEGAFMGDAFVPTATYDSRDALFAVSTMRNVLFDLNGAGGRFSPYVGLGLGGVGVTGDIITDAIGRADWINDTAFAYQFIVGATQKLNQRTEAYAEFRHFGTSGLELENDAGDPVTDFAFQNNTVVFGFRINRPARTCCGN